MAGSVPVAIAAASPYGVPGIVIGAVAVVLATAIMVAVPEWFRLLVLRQPSRDLRQIIMHSDSIEDTERLAKVLRSLHAETPDADSHGRPGTRDRRRRQPRRSKQIPGTGRTP